MKRVSRLQVGGFAATVLLSALLFLLCYRFDNKYTTGTPQPRNGILLLDEDTLTEHPVLYPITDWEWYPGLLTPEALRGDAMRHGRSVFIGQYTGFNLDRRDLPRHGSATLALNIAVPEQPRSYALELPEIYSAYRLYVNGALLCELGNPEPDSYRPRTGNRTVEFTASGNIELVLAMTDYTHIYSGLVYPPAFGEPEAVQRQLARRLILRAMVAAVALALGGFYLVLGLFLRRRGESGWKQAVLYGLLCLCFMGYTCYPVIKSAWSGGLWWYVTETFCYCAMLLLVMLLQGRLCGYRGKWARLCPALGALVCACSLLLPAIARGPSAVVRLWSAAVSGYFLLCALYLTGCALYGLLRGGVGSPALLCGALVFDTALVMDRLLPDHEPILTGWFSEWAGAALVLCTGVLILQDILAQYRRRRALEENMDSMRSLMETQMAFYPLVLEQAEEARASRHDLRHHMAAVQGFAQRGEYDGLNDYLSGYSPAAEPSPVVFCGHPVLNMLLSNTAARARAQGVDFTAFADVPDALTYADPDLFAVCANLLENALEASAALPEERRWIKAGIRRASGSLIISVDNAFDGAAEERNGVLLSRKRPGEPGIGTASVGRIARRYGGSATYRWENTEQGAVFHADILLPGGREE